MKKINEIFISKGIKEKFSVEEILNIAQQAKADKKIPDVNYATEARNLFIFTAAEKYELLTTGHEKILSAMKGCFDRLPNISRSHMAKISAERNSNSEQLSL